MLINKGDIRTYCKLGWNVEGADPFIQEAQDTMEAMLPPTLFSAIESMVEAGYGQWSRQTTYAAGDKVMWDGIQYKCILISTANEPPNATYWTVQSLQTAWDYLKIYLVYLSYSKFLTEHGIVVTHMGIERYSAESATPASAAERAGMVNKYRDKANSAWGKFMKWIDDESYTIDTVSYPFTGTDIVEHKSSWGFFDA